MHLLPCPSCQSSIEVSPSQAGDQAPCPSCHADVDIPKLGELRQLPLVEQQATADAAPQSQTSAARSAGFLVLGLIATGSLLIAGFCGIRWVLIDVPNSTEEHISTLREQYKELSAAQLVREYEQMDEYDLDLSAPFEYKRIEKTKASWGRNASIAGTIGICAIMGAIGLAMTTQRNRV